MLGLIALIACGAFSVLTGAETVNYLGNIAMQSCTLDTLEGFVASASLASAVGAVVLKSEDGTEFKVKSDEELAKLSEEDLGQYMNDHMKASVANQARIEKLLKEANSPEAIKDLQTQVNKAVEGHMEVMKSQMKIQGETITMLKSEKNMKEKTFQGQVLEAIKERHDEIREAFKNRSTVEVFKAVGPVTTGSATNPDGIPEIAGVQMAAPSNVNLAATFIDSLVTRIQTTLAAYPYTETVPKEGNAAFTAEGTDKSQIDFSMETRYAQPVKCTAYEVLTQESIEDIPGLQSIATDYLKKKHDLKRQNGILFGDGIAPNPKGATVYGRAFVAGAMANKVTAPNFMDVVNACVTDIYVTPNYVDETPYMANIVMVNPVDFYLELVSAKDDNGLPLYPTAALFNRVTIGGTTIIPFMDIPTGEIFVADMSKYNVTDYVGYSVSMGWINDQFIKNQFTMVGESRFHAFVKNLDEAAFIFDTIADVKAAILAP